MQGHKTALLIRVRQFGALEGGTHTVWPQDRVRSMGLDVVPGFVVDATLPDQVAASDITAAIEEATRNIAGHWRHEECGSISQDERFLVQAWARPATNRARDVLVLMNINGAIDRGAAKDCETAQSTLRDILCLCLYFQPAIEATLTKLQSEALARAHVARLCHLSAEQIWLHAKDILVAYREMTGADLPTTPGDQLALAILQLAQQAQRLNAISTASPTLVSLSVRFRPMRLVSPKCGCGVVVCGPGIEPADDRGSYALGTGLDQIEAGGFHVQPIAGLLSDPLVAQALDHINHVCANEQNGFYRVSFLLAGQRLLIDTINQVTPTAEMSLAGVAARCLQGLAPHSLAGITQQDVRLMLYPRLRLTERDAPAARGVPAAPGACSGVLSTSIDSATRFHREGLPIIFCAPSPTPEALRALSLSEGVIFQAGGITSHIAVIARGRGKPCILSVDNLEFMGETSREIRLGHTVVSEGHWISMDGTSGHLYLGHMETARTPLQHKPLLSRVLDCCDTVSRMSVYVNADNADEADEGFSYGAKAVGLCRVEHMLATPEALTTLSRALALGLTAIDTSAHLLLRELKSAIWSDSDATLKALQSYRQTALQDASYGHFTEALRDLQHTLKEEIHRLLVTAGSRPVTIRFLDPPLSEFLSEQLFDELAQEGLITAREGETGKSVLSTAGGMLGIRGIRLGLLMPELTEMQALAVKEAAREVSTSHEGPGIVNLMAPFISDPVELQLFRLIVSRCLATHSPGDQPTIRIGGMIETPRAAIMAYDLAKEADFLSFGTNDLSQFVWATSRDSADVGFLGRPPYAAMECAPFMHFDEKGVGPLVAHATRQARLAKALPIGVCGEHARDAKAIRFFAALGIDYVSCAPFAVPETRLAVAQATLAATAAPQMTSSEHAVAPCPGLVEKEGEA
jgi:phosphohistidine swiveling domain-containing protein